jgi:hypothetical protein
MSEEYDWDLGLRGGCDDTPLDLTGEFTGYNNGATMQVGLWITNDGEHIEAARRAASNGPQALKDHLVPVMRDAPFPSAAHSTWDAAVASGGGIPAVDWAQICFDLVFVEPDDEDLAAAGRELAARYGFQDPPSYSEIWERAYTLNQEAAERVATRGIQ